MCQALFPEYTAVNKTDMAVKHTAVGKMDHRK